MLTHLIDFILFSMNRVDVLKEIFLLAKCKWEYTENSLDN